MPEIQRMTGFQSPCSEYAEDNLSLDIRFITHPSATFFVWCMGDSKALRVRKGDLLLIDRSLIPKEGDLIMAILNNQHVLGRFFKHEGIGHIFPQNRRLGEDEFNEDCVFGVVKSLHRDRP